MSREECLQLLTVSRLARLGCARENQPYVVPVTLAYDDDYGCLYGFTTPGQKVEWMRANPRVCVEVDDVTSYDQWESVIVTGRYEELPEKLESDAARLAAPARPRQVYDALPSGPVEGDQRKNEDERLRAFNLLRTQVAWWEPGWAAWAARANRDPGETYRIVYYKIWIEHITGHAASRNAK